jgi:hypothetical protein
MCECDSLSLLNYEIYKSTSNGKVCYSDPIILSGKVIAYRIKGTLGITG